MKLVFVTGNKGKLAEAQAILPEISQRDVELEEVQSLDPKVVIGHKLAQVKDEDGEAVFVEDTSLEIRGMKGLPGTLIKWFLKTVGAEGLAQMAEAMGETEAISRTVVGLRIDGQEKFFEGVTAGKVVLPRGERGFGWDGIFVPEGFDKTYAEMEIGIKNQVSSRKKALENMASYLKERK